MAEMSFERDGAQETKEISAQLRRHKQYDCSNTMTMAGPKVDVLEAVRFISTPTSEFSFAAVAPIPEELLTFNPLNIKPSVLAKWEALDKYTFKMEKWCTPREPINIERSEIEMSETQTQRFLSHTGGKLFIEHVATYKFDTPMSPPSGVYHELSKKFPKVMFHYTFDIACEEEDTSGWALAIDGKIKNRVQYPTSFRTMKLHLEPFNESWLTLSEDNDNDGE
jgi:hypothetical protein